MKLFIFLPLKITVFIAPELTYSILAIVAMGIFFEGLKYFRELVQSKQVQDSSYGNSVM